MKTITIKKNKLYLPLIKRVSWRRHLYTLQFQEVLPLFVYHHQKNPNYFKNTIVTQNLVNAFSSKIK